MAAKNREKCSVENIEKKLSTFNSSQESVQAMSMWIMQNRSYHQRIVDTWLKVLKKSETKHKLTLFYLCNDVVQHAKRKKALYYLENFKDNLREAVMHVRDAEKIRPNIERVLGIWEQRKTYDIKYVTELRRILSGDYAGTSSKESSAKSTPMSPISPRPLPEKSRKREKRKGKDKVEKVEVIETDFNTPPREEKEVEEEEEEEAVEDMADFKPPKFIEEMTSLRQIEVEVTTKAKQLTSMRIDATNVDAVKQLKDRSHGADFCKQFEESCIKIEDYVTTLEREIKRRKIVVAHCDVAESFYEEQFKEAKIVATAYKNYGARITNMKKRVDDMKKIIPSTPSPVPSPSADAPSPGNSPVLPEMDDNDMVDMDLCEEQDLDDGRKTLKDPNMPVLPFTFSMKGSDVGQPGRAYTAMVKSIPQPIPSLTNITIGEKENEPVQKEDSLSPEPLKPEEATSTFQGSNILESRIANMLPNLAKGSSNIGLNMPAAPGKALEDFSPPHKPVEEPEPSDDRASTPVQDEQEEKAQNLVKDFKVSEPAKTMPTTKIKTNPIDFLSQLLTKSSSSSSSSNFLHSLSLLTNTVKNQHQKKENGDESVNTQDNEPVSPTVSEPQQAPMAFTGVPAPEPVTQSSSWPEWKNIGAPNLVKPPPPPSPDNISPPVMTSGQPPLQPPTQPPLPQHPPPPIPGSTQHHPPALNIPPPQRYPVQPPSPQDFSMPPPVSQTFPRPSVSQSFLTPPLLSQTFSQRPPPPPPHNTAVTPPLSINPVSPTQLPPPRPHFNQGFPFGLPPVQNVSTPNSVAPPPSPGVYRPPLPPQSVAPPPPPWQPENVQESAQVPNSSFNNRIATVPSIRSDWNEGVETEYDPSQTWEDDDNETNGQDTGYVHPWDQPQNYDEDEEDEEEEEDVAVPSGPVMKTPKSILRNSRSSSLREVIIIDDNEENSDNNNFNVSVSNVPPDIKPVGILKKPPTDIQHPPDHIGDVQSEFIAKLKQKSGGQNVPSGPPSSRTLTTVQQVDNSGNQENKPGGYGEQISTIGVLGSGSCGNSVQSDDMDIDNGDGDEGNIEVNNENEWVDETEDEEWLEERQAYISRDFNPNLPPLPPPQPLTSIPLRPHEPSDLPTRPLPPAQQLVGAGPVHQQEQPIVRPVFDEHGRPPPPRPYPYEHRPYHPPQPPQPRPGFHHPHHFPEHFRGPPPPEKRPFYPPSPGLRMPYYRY